jgi:hypothetical protein
VIDEDAAHHLRYHGQKLYAVLPDGVLLIDETDVRLVYERGRLQDVSRTFASQMDSRTTAQLAVHERHRAIAGIQVPRVPGAEELRNLLRLAHGGSRRPILVAQQTRVKPASQSCAESFKPMRSSSNS